MTRIKKSVFLCLVVALILCCIAGFGLRPLVAKADETKELPEVAEIENLGGEEEAVPYGIYTALSLALDGGNGEVWASVKNAFTLFPATVRVVVELYCSDTYQENHSTMTLVGRNSTNDLNMNETIEYRTAINGVQKYWKARMYYKIDNKNWQEKETDSYLLDPNGIYVM